MKRYTYLGLCILALVFVLSGCRKLPDELPATQPTQSFTQPTEETTTVTETTSASEDLDELPPIVVD